MITKILNKSKLDKNIISKNYLCNSKKFQLTILYYFIDLLKKTILNAKLKKI